MELKDWLKVESGRTKRLADYLTTVLQRSDPTRRIAESNVWAWTQDPDRKGGRPIPPKFGHAIEQFTAGQVMRWDVAPDDWFLYWPDLIPYRGAPPVPAEAAAASPGAPVAAAALAN